VRVLLPRLWERRARAFQWAANEVLAKPLLPREVDELLWYLEATSHGTLADWRRHGPRMREAMRTFRGPRFIALRRYWRTVGATAIVHASANAPRDALERGRGQVERITMTHDYDYLRALARRNGTQKADHRGDEPQGSSGPPASVDGASDRPGRRDDVADLDSGGK
jgi:hypothetical protein